MKVYVVTVFESGDFTTSVWGVFKHKEDAENYKEELDNDGDYKKYGNYLNVTVTEHEVE